MSQNGFDLAEMSLSKDPVCGPSPSPKGMPSGLSHYVQGTSEALLQPVGFQHHLTGFFSYTDL